MNNTLVLLPYQAAWIEDNANIRVWEKSRRIGASWCAAAEAVILSARTNGMNTWYVGYNQDMANEFIGDASEWTRNLQIAASEISESIIEDERGDILTYEIRFSSGFKIKALSSRPTNLRGKQGYVIIDEAAYHDDLAGLIKAAIALLMWGGRIAVLSTHNGVDNPFAELIQDALSGKKKYSHHKTTLGDAVAQGLYDRICLRQGIERTAEGQKKWTADLIALYGDDAQEELYCVPSKSGGRYLSHTIIGECMYDAPVIRYELTEAFAAESDEARTNEALDWCDENLKPLLRQLPIDTNSFFGEDFGRTADITVIAPFVIMQDLTRKVPFLVELRRVPFQQQEQILFCLVDGLPRFTFGALDATGNGQYLAERAMQRYGEERIEQVHLSDKWYSTYLPPFKAALEDKRMQIPRDMNIKDDLRAFQVINGVPRLPKAKTQRKGQQPRHGDAAIALTLGYYASKYGEDALERLRQLTTGMRG